MRRVLFWVVLFALLALALALVLQADHGYVLAVYPPWRVEMSLALLALILLLSHILFYVLMRVLRTTLRLPRDVKAWRMRRRLDEAEEALKLATAALLAGEHAQALKLARQSLDHTPLPLAALVGAQAALQLGQTAAAQALLDAVPTEQGEFAAAHRVISLELERRAAQARDAAPVSLSADGLL